MLRTRLAAIVAASAIAVGTLAAATPAQAATYPFDSYSPRFLDIGPVVYSLAVQSESSAMQKVNVGGVTKTVQSQWEISEQSVESKAGDQYDDNDNLIEPSYPELPTVHVGYWVARYAATQFGLAEDRFLDGTVDEAAAFYNSVVNTSPSVAAAYFTASDAKAARIAAVKADVVSNGKKAFSYVANLVGKRGADYVHAHKAAITKKLNSQFKHSKLYSGSVKLKFTRDFVVQMGPTKADRDRQLHYTITVRDTTDKVAYAIELNTHDGGAYGYGVYKVKY